MRKFIIGAAIAPLFATGAIAENLEHGFKSTRSA